MAEERKESIIHTVCGDCKAEWDEHFSVPMLVDVFCAKLRAIRCPQCGGNKALIPTSRVSLKEEKCQINQLPKSQSI